MDDSYVLRSQGSPVGCAGVLGAQGRTRRTNDDAVWFCHDMIGIHTAIMDWTHTILQDLRHDFENFEHTDASVAMLQQDYFHYQNQYDQQ